MNCLWSEAIDYHHYCFMNLLELNSTHRKIPFRMVVLFSLELRLYWLNWIWPDISLFLKKFFLMSLFGRFSYWARIYFTEAISPRYGPGIKHIVVEIIGKLVFLRDIMLNGAHSCGNYWKLSVSTWYYVKWDSFFNNWISEQRNVEKKLKEHITLC